MRHLLDTGVFWRPAALRQLAQSANPVVVPAVTFLERVRKLVQQERDVGEFVGWLERNRFQVEAFGPQEALRFGVRMLDDAVWKRLARDAMIAGHVRPEDVVWTTNRADFEEIGIPKEQIVDA